MRSRHIAMSLLALGMISPLPACTSVRRALGMGDGSTESTSPFGHWVLATPADSTAFAGATQVELVLAPGSFDLTAAYPNRPRLAIRGRAEVTDGGLLTLIPTRGSAEEVVVGFVPGQPFTRIASAAGATLVLASPSARIPVPSSVWHRLEVARAAGLVR